MFGVFKVFEQLRGISCRGAFDKISFLTQLDMDEGETRLKDILGYGCRLLCGGDRLDHG